MSRAGVLHRDVSIGNVLIVDDEADQTKFVGFLHDFDYSSMSKKPPVKNLLRCKAAKLTQYLFSGDDFLPELKERTASFSRECTCYEILTRESSGNVPFPCL